MLPIRSAFNSMSRALASSLQNACAQADVLDLLESFSSSKAFRKTETRPPTAQLSPGREGVPGPVIQSVPISEDPAVQSQDHDLRKPVG